MEGSAWTRKCSAGNGIRRNCEHGENTEEARWRRGIPRRARYSAPDGSLQSGLRRALFRVGGIAGAAAARGWLFDPELFHSVAQRRRRQTENLCRTAFAGNCTLRSPQDFLNIIPLDLFQSAKLSGRRGSSSAHGKSLLTPQRMNEQDLPFGQQDCALDHMFKLAHIPRPSVVLESLDRR